jgi:NitT/TauT family transport system substrate-binding protein
MRRSFVALLVSATLFAACAGPAATPPSPAPSSAAQATPKPPKDKVTLTGINSTELNLPTLVAIAKDYFGEENIELGEFVIGSSGTLRQAMIAKQYDFGLYAFVHIPIARLAGSPFKSVIELHDQEIFGLVVRTQLRDQVKTVKDLRGRKIGFTTPGSGTWALGNVYLKKAGLDPEKDAELVSLGGDNAVFYTALQSGRVDAIVSFEPIAERVIADNVGYFLLDIYAPGQHRDQIGSDKAAALHLVTREDVIASKPDLVKRMVNVQKKGLDFIRASSASAIAELIMGNPTSAAQFQGFDRALVTKVIDHIKTGFGTGCISKAGFDTELKISTDYKLVSGPITFEQFADTSFAGGC